MSVLMLLPELDSADMEILDTCCLGCGPVLIDAVPWRFFCCTESSPVDTVPILLYSTDFSTADDHRTEGVTL